MLVDSYTQNWKGGTLPQSEPLCIVELGTAAMQKAILADAPLGAVVQYSFVKPLISLCAMPVGLPDSAA